MTAKIEEKIVNFASVIVNGSMKGWFTFGVLIFLVSCAEPKVEDGYLTEPELALVLLDIYMIEGKLSYADSELSSMDMFPIYKQGILEKHGLTDSIYDANMVYYITNPVFLDKAYEIMLDSLKLRRQALPGALPE